MNPSNSPHFTPGPWELEAGRSFKTASGSFYLAYGNNPKSGRPEFGNFMELDANARLIAAAPDMFTALDELLTLYYGDKLVREHDALSTFAAEVAFQNARNAIYKALGRETA